jgi:membrane protein YqaA with SNARE-associated domain
MLRRLYNWTMSLAGSRHALFALGAVAFAESSFFPVPPDLVLVPMVLADRGRARLYALICTVASVSGGLLGYLIGALLYDSLGQWLISAYGYGKGMEEFRAAYAEWGAWIILIKGMTPIPYKIVTITSGFAGYNIWAFLGLSVITRGLRFFIVAELLRHYGEPVRDFIERRLTLVTTVFLLVVVGGFFVARYIV